LGPPEIGKKELYLEKSCQMINTVARGVVGRNRSLSAGQVLKICKDLGVAEKEKI